MSFETVIDFSQITLAVIAGGTGERMGMPKSWLSIRREPILQYLLRRMKWSGATMLVTAPGVEHPPAANLFDHEAIDPVRGLGPLYGLLTALEHSASPIVACIAVDMVAVNRAMVINLIRTLTADVDALGVMYSTTNEKNCGRQPFPSAFRREARKEVRSRIARGQMSVHGLVETPGFKLLEPPVNCPATFWTNLNVPHELDAFEASQSCADSLKRPS
jgi:molybdenum cofactor guanylyltransferase